MKLKSYLPKQALERLTSNNAAVLVDVRSQAENKFVGRPLDCVFVPWLDEPDWVVDEDKFVESVGRFEIGFETEIILICRSGYRSHDAGKCLLANGFSSVAHVISGFEGDLDEHNQRGNINGWRFDGLLWEQC